MITNLVSRRSQSPVAPATGSGRVIPARVRPQTSQTCYHRNQQYSIVGLTNAAGTLVERYTYSAYGTLGIYAANGTVRTSSTYANRYTYTGREWDAELRLYHFRARWYDPATGGFVSRDPLGYVDGMSLYRGYFGVKGVDPWGLWKWEIGSNGALFAISELNDTLSGLVALGYDAEKLKLIAKRPLNESLPEGTVVDITSLFPDAVGHVLQHQQRMMITREMLSEYLNGFSWWDPQTGVEELAEENYPEDKELIRIARAIAERKEATAGSVGFYKINTLLIKRYRGICLDFAALGLGIYDGGAEPWDCSFEIFDVRKVLIDGRKRTQTPGFRSLVLVANGDTVTHAGIFLGRDSNGRKYVICRRGGSHAVVVDTLETPAYPGYEGVVDYYEPSNR